MIFVVKTVKIKNSIYNGGFMKKKNAFTLAEVLITLGIIGIVAAMTMPTLIQKNNEKATVTKLKKFMSVMNSTLQMSIEANGPIESWGLTKSVYDEETGTNPEETKVSQDYFIKTYILPYIKYVKYCSPTSSDCYKYDRYSLDGTAFGTLPEQLILADGAVINSFWFESSSCSLRVGDMKQLSNICGQIFYDTNGRKGPNKTGEDVFLFYFTKYGVVPMGTAMETSEMSGSFKFSKYCNKSIPNRLNGYGCTAWVIYNENMDYLHCNDLSWDGKKTCK